MEKELGKHKLSYRLTRIFYHLASLPRTQTLKHNLTCVKVFISVREKTEIEIVQNRVAEKSIQKK